MRFPSSLASAVAVATFAASGTLASAQFTPPMEFKVLVQQGDVIPAIGNVTTIDNLAINDKGEWLVLLDTDSLDVLQDALILRDGAVYLREGGALPAPIGASIKAFGSINLDNDGHSAFNLTLNGTGGTSNDTAVYHDTDLQIQEGQISIAATLTPGSPYVSWLGAKANDSGAFVMICNVEDTAIAGTGDGAFMLGIPLPTGGIGAELVLHKESDVLAGQTEWVASFASGPTSWAANASNQLMYIADLNGDTTVDSVMYLDSTLLAQEGSPTPVAGRNWLGFTSSAVDVNDAGDYVFTGAMNGDLATNLILVKNGQKIVQEGDTLPAFAPFKLTGFQSAPVAIDRDGNVLWFGDWDDPDLTKDTGLFLNDQLVIQEGVTTVGGQLVQSIAIGQSAFSFSDNGRYALVEVTLAGGINAAVLITPADSVTPLPGCVGNPGSLALGSGAPVVGSSFSLALDGAQVSAAFGLLALAGTPPAAAPCGIVVAGMGEVLVGLAPAPITMGVGLWTGAPLAKPFQLPASPGLIGVRFWCQGAFADFVGSSGEAIRLTNGLEIRVGGAQ